MKLYPMHDLTQRIPRPFKSLYYPTWRLGNVTAKSKYEDRAREVRYG